LYGLMMFTRTLGPQARLVHIRLTAPRSLNLSAWAVQIRSHILHVLLIDKGSRTARVDVRVRATGAASVQRLLAPSPYSRTGVTLNGQRLDSASHWTGTPRTDTIAPSASGGGYVLTLARRSAALMSLRLLAAHRGPAVTRRRRSSEHHRRVPVPQNAVLAVGLDRSRKH
jgi:hypothetical protein